MPSSVAVHDVVEPLAGPARVDPVPLPDPPPADVVLGYVSESGELGALWQLDRALAVTLVSRMLVMPADRVAEQAVAWSEDPMVDALLEAGNILGTLANGAELAHVRVGPVWRREGATWQLLTVSGVLAYTEFPPCPPAILGESAAFAVAVGDAPTARAMFSWLAPDSV